MISWRPSAIRVTGPFLVHLLVASGESAEDCNFNGVDDDRDLADGTSADCNSNGVPDECDVRADLDFLGATVLPLGDLAPNFDFELADLDGDGDLDLVACRWTLDILWNLGGRRFSQAESSGYTPSAWVM